MNHNAGLSLNPNFSFTNSTSTGHEGAAEREPLRYAQRKADFTSLPCSSTNINTASFHLTGPGRLIPQHLLSTKYHYYSNCSSWVLFPL